MINDLHSLMYYAYKLMMTLCSGRSVLHSGRSTKVVVALAVVALTVQAITEVVTHFSSKDGHSTLFTVEVVVFLVVLPVTILIINVPVVCAVRRAWNTAPASLDQQSTSSSSAVPTVMLVSTSLVYVLLCCTWAVVYFVYNCTGTSKAMDITDAFLHLIYAYNFYVYLITGKQFRLELSKLFHCCTPPHHAAAAAADRADDDAVRQPPRQADTSV